MALEGKRVLITRTPQQSKSIAKGIEEKGGVPVFLPCVTIQPLRDLSILDYRLLQLESYTWLILTSANGARFFFERMKENNLTLPEAIKIATVGEVTRKSVEEEGYIVDFTPSKFEAEILANELPLAENESVLLPQSAIARKNLTTILEERGAKVDSVSVYETVSCTPTKEEVEQADLANIDWVCFTSGSTVRGFKSILNTYQLDLNLNTAVIGPITRDAAVENGFNVLVEAMPYTVEGLIAGMEKY